jgi:hypothetical protein
LRPLGTASATPVSFSPSSSARLLSALRRSRPPGDGLSAASHARTRPPADSPARRAPTTRRPGCSPRASPCHGSRRAHG